MVIGLLRSAADRRDDAQCQPGSRAGTIFTSFAQNIVVQRRTERIDVMESHVLPKILHISQQQQDVRQGDRLSILGSFSRAMSLFCLVTY